MENNNYIGPKVEDPILSVRNLEVQFKVRDRVLTAIRNISMDFERDKVVAIVGESGSGKSVFTKTFTGMLDSNGIISNGEIFFEGKDISKFTKDEEWMGIRGAKIATIFQDPLTSLNPVRTIGSQIAEVIIKHRKKNKKEAKEIAVELMQRVGIIDAENRYDEYPFQFSGGMRQRIVIAIALACHPKILICDEPTTALDVTIQSQILELIKDLGEEYGFTTIYITHDLGVVANVADVVAVMYAGQIIELGKVDEIFYSPCHPYTWGLLSSLPQFGEKGKDLFAIKGTPPSLFKKIEGDGFAPRSEYSMKIDFVKEPKMYKVTDTHYAKTWLLDERAPKAEKPKTIQDLHKQMVNLTSKGGVYSHTLDEDANLELNKSEKIEIMRKDSGEDLGYDMTDDNVLCECKGVDIVFDNSGEPFKAVDNASFKIYKGETLSLVGESGSGKTTIARAIIGLNKTAAGDIIYKGNKINKKLSKEERQKIVREVQMIFQDPAASLNERATVDYCVAEGLDNFHLYENEEDRAKKVDNVLREVGLLPEHKSRYPHEFSGGQRQRIGIARSIVMEPDFIIADEPISALDVSIRAQVLNLLNRFQKERNLTYLFIAHDLSVVRYFSDRIAVIHKGRIVEIATTNELFAYPLHPYTRSLLQSVPIPDPAIEKKKKVIKYDREKDFEGESAELLELYKNHYVLMSEGERDKYIALYNKMTEDKEVAI